MRYQVMSNVMRVNIGHHHVIVRSQIKKRERRKGEDDES